MPRSNHAHDDPQHVLTQHPPPSSNSSLRSAAGWSVTGLDAGADTIAWHLQHHHRTTVSRATIYRIIRRADLITPESRKKPKSAYIRFQAQSRRGPPTRQSLHPQIRSAFRARRGWLRRRRVGARSCHE